MRLVIAFINVLFLVGCSSTKVTTEAQTENTDTFFNIIAGKTKNYNDTATTGEILLQIKDFNPTKQIFSQLSKEITKSDDVVYLFTWTNDLPTVTFRFSAILLDRSANKKYYLYNLKGDKTIQITNQKPSDFTSHDYVLYKYLLGQVDSLYAMQNLFSSAEMGQDYTLFKIHPSKPRVDLFHLSSVVVMQH